MTARNIVIALAVVVVVLIGILVYYSPVIEKPPVSPELTEEPAILPPPATGDVDDLVDALTSELFDEDPLLIEGERDAEVITTDSQEIDDFGQTINENEL